VIHEAKFSYYSKEKNKLEFEWEGKVTYHSLLSDKKEGKLPLYTTLNHREIVEVQLQLFLT